MPSRSRMRCRQPSAWIFETSSNLRGVPSGLVGVPGEFALESDHVADQLRQLADGDILAAPDINDLGAVIFFEEESAGRRQIVDVEKFAARLARSPDQQLTAPSSFAACALRRSAGRTCEESRSKLSLGP